MGIDFVKATAKDKEYLFILRKLTMVEHTACAGLHLTEAEHNRRVNNSYECCFLIMASQQKVGMIKYFENKECFFISQFQIHPHYQGHGIGKSVIQQIITKASAKGKHVELTVLKVNRAVALYRRLDFVITSAADLRFHMKHTYTHTSANCNL